ncbi:prepilin-type N-terminal cleavage/methylation domain-containing protein [Aestuariirhabdus haliotis]|uniref:prepilin-type N-terminal cleavage/methylation domain-containing protein n=1 Tax=Aestuariirhabdus haliotis TaxID=2918751 RepID=UPI0029E7CE05|nr:prepilin-type N-terminal cleavage/methylation domain-containing protein [Aestuariirhabdus haliotis]
MKSIKSMTTKQQGFTLIELIIVIVILGILSAFALPRFADLGGDARAASVSGALGAVRSAAAIAHSAQLAGNIDPNTSVSLEGTSIALSNGYPTAASIQTAAQLSAEDYTLNVSGTTLTVQGTGATTLTTCQFTYTQALSGAAPVVTPTITDCN